MKPLHSQKNSFRYLQLLTGLLFFSVSVFQNSSDIYSQVVNVSVDNGIYDFLEKMNLKGLIRLDDEVKPFSRNYIAGKIIEAVNLIAEKKSVLNSLEIEELKFYSREYKFEIDFLLSSSLSIQSSYVMNFFSDLNERWYLLGYSDSLFNIKFSPIASYGISAANKLSGHSRSIGISTYGSYSDWFGFSFDLRDKGEFGDNVDKKKYFSPLRGAWTKGAPNGIEYSDVKGSINFNWKWGSISLIKDYLQWGHGKFGQLILSDKSPSYPHIRLQLKPVEWLRFSYIHGWLSSQIYDSAYFYNSYPGSISQTLIKSYIPKYIAANIVTLSPLQWLDVSAGNAVIYGGELRPEFFLPFMFYKFLDHNSGRGDVNDANGVMYFDIAVKYPVNFKWYSTLLIDVTEIRNILDNDFRNTWIGFTLGGKSIDLIIDNLDLSIEYTRINPWVYEHKNEVTNYKHLKYPLGHWLGQNADQFRIQFDFQLLRGLKFKLYNEYIRKGGLEEIYYAYSGMKIIDLPFLYPPLRTENRLGFEFIYEYLHDLILKGSYVYSDINDQEAAREPVFMIGSKNSYSITLFYGL